MERNQGLYVEGDTRSLMWVWRRMEKVSWKDKKTNEEVLKAVGEERVPSGRERRTGLVIS